MVKSKKVYLLDLKSVNTGHKFEDQLSEEEKAAWKSFKSVTTNFFGKS
jgi:hypothetical protein